MLIPNWDGEQASTAATKIDTLLDVLIVLASFVFSAVMVMLVYAVWKWRAKPGDESDGAPIHGNTRLEIAWTVIPTVIVMFLAGYSWITLDNIEAHDPDRMVVDVYSQQYEWHFDYPETGTTSRSCTCRSIARSSPHARPRRHSLLLGPGVADQEGQRAGITTRAYVFHEDGRLHPDLHRGSAASATRPCAPVVVESSQAAWQHGRRASRRSRPTSRRERSSRTDRRCRSRSNSDLRNG
jgi:hypothetical protein